MVKEGVWMAIGPSQNVIVKVVGETPFAKIVKGILMNDFFRTGRVKELDESSMEIQHIMQNPEQYSFEELTVSRAVYNALGIGVRTFEKCTIEEEDIKVLMKEYRDYIELYGSDKDPGFIIKLCKRYNISTGQASNILENKIKRILNFRDM